MNERVNPAAFRLIRENQEQLGRLLDAYARDVMGIDPESGEPLDPGARRATHRERPRSWGGMHASRKAPTTREAHVSRGVLPPLSCFAYWVPHPFTGPTGHRGQRSHGASDHRSEG